MFSVIVLLNRLSDVVPVLLRSKQPVLPAGVRWRSLSRIRMPKKLKVCQCLFLLLFRMNYCEIPNSCDSRAEDSRLLLELQSLEELVQWVKTEVEPLASPCTPSPAANTAASQVPSILFRRTRLLLSYAVPESFCLFQLFPQRRLKWPSLHLQWMEKPTWSSFASWLRFWSWRKATYIWTRFLWKYTYSPTFLQHVQVMMLFWDASKHLKINR